MKTLSTTLLAVGFIGQLSLFAQTKLKVTPEHPGPRQTVVIEVDVQPDPNTAINWEKESGEGEFTTPTRNTKKVEFVPSKPGDVVVIVCEIKTPDGEFRPRATISVGGQPTPVVAPEAIVAKPQPPTPQPQKPAVIAPPPGSSSLLLSTLPDVVPAGYMGDAMVENGKSADFDAGQVQGCRTSNQSCFRVSYRVAEAKLGWAAFAWQRVIEGGDNWGKSPGLDLNDDGYKSLRVWAKGQDNSGTFPRIQFKSGGNVAPEYATKNRATYNVAGPTVQLTGQWAEYCLDLKGKDLSNVVSPFTVVVTKASNAKGADFLLDDIQFSKQLCQK
jgi:hypothetical protein